MDNLLLDNTKSLCHNNSVSSAVETTVMQSSASTILKSELVISLNLQRNIYSTYVLNLL